MYSLLGVILPNNHVAIWIRDNVLFRPKILKKKFFQPVSFLFHLLDFPFSQTISSPKSIFVLYKNFCGSPFFFL